MIRTLEAGMLNLAQGLKELAPLCAAAGIQALSPSRAMLEDEAQGREAKAILDDNGLTWGLMPMPADFYHWDLDDAAFENALKTLAKQAEAAEKLGVRHAYNHVWSSGPREFDENFAWHVDRVGKVGNILSDHGVHYGLEFLGPHELRTWQKYEFVHSLAGVVAIADAAGGNTGVALDTFHWYCSNNGCRDELMWIAQHIDRLVAVHMNDAVAGVPYNEQKDMQRRLPMETGVIDTRAILNLLKAHENDALYMIEPFEPWRTRFHAMSAQEVVAKAVEIFDLLEK